MQRSLEWLQENRALFIDFVRIYLGFVLIVKGLYFIQDITKLTQMIGMSESSYTTLALAHYIVFAHIVGGLFLAIGLLTRVVVLFQIPILAGAVVLVHLKEGLFAANSSLEYALLVLMLLVAFGLYGSGRFSVDQLLDREQK